MSVEESTKRSATNRGHSLDWLRNLVSLVTGSKPEATPMARAKSRAPRPSDALDQPNDEP